MKMSQKSFRSIVSRVVILTTIAITVLSFTTAGTSAARVSFIDTVGEFLGLSSKISASPDVLLGRVSRSGISDSEKRSGIKPVAVPNRTAPVTKSGIASVATIWNVSVGSIGACTTGDPNCATIVAAIAAASSGDTINVSAGTYTETGQILINKNLTIIGANNVTTIIKPAGDTGTSGDTRGWFLVQSGFSFNLSDVTLDGTDRETWQAIRYNGSGIVNNVKFKNIQYQASGPSYNGGGVRIGASNVNVTNSTFNDMGRYGVLAEGVGSGTISGNSYTGKGVGDWLDYAFDIEFGANYIIFNNQISGNRGVASSDGSDSAGISIWDDPGTQANLSGNSITNSSTGVAIAMFSGATDPLVTIGPGNVLSGGGVGIGIQDIGPGTGTPALTVTSSTITNNTTTGIFVAALMSTTGTTIHFSRIAGNASGINNGGLGTINVENNWWGCNAGPGNAGCDSVTGLADFDPWIVLLGSATPANIGPFGTSTVSADMTNTSAAAIPVGTLPNIPVGYSATNGGMSPTSDTIVAGADSSLFTSSSASSAVATITVDGQAVNVPITVTASPTITGSGGNDIFTVNISGGNLQILQNGSPVFSGPMAGLTSVTIDGAAANDALQFTGDGTTTAVYTPSPTTNGDGTVLLNGTLNVIFVNFEPLDISGMATAAVASPVNAANALVMNAGFDSATGTIPAIVVSGTTGVTPIETAHLFNNTNAVIDTSSTTGGAGSNTITDSSAIPLGHLNTNITLKTNANGTVTFNADLLATGAISIDTPTINLNADITTAGKTTTAATVTFNVNDAPSGKIQDAIGLATNGDTINVAAGTYVEIGQITINKSLSIVGENKATTIVKPAQDTGFSGDARGWVLVGTGHTVNMSGVTFDGVGRLICFGIYDYSLGTLQDLNVKNIGCGAYNGRGIYLKNNATVRGVRFENIERIGVFVWTGATAAVIDGNTYVGKGPGDHLDYGVELGNGGVATITNNTISGNTGVALSDGSDSAGILASTLFGPGTQATITGNTITGNGVGIVVGCCAAGDTSAVTAHFNRIVGNGIGIRSSNPDVNAENNWWGCNDGPGVGGGLGCTGTPNGVVNTGTGSVDANPWIVLTTSASPSMVGPGGMSTITASMLTNSAPGPAVGGPVPDMPVAFSATNGTISNAEANITAGDATATFTSTSASSGTGCATVDGQQTCANVTVVPPPLLTTVTTITGAVPEPSLVNQSYAVTWTTTVTSPGVGTPTGNVTVADGTGGTCTAPVAAGTCNLTSTTVGIKTLIATYSGDANFNASTSTGFAHTVNLQITGTVSQAPAMTPLLGVTITLSGCASATTTTNASGVYTFAGTYTGTCTLTPSGLGKIYDPVYRTYNAVSNNITGADFTAYNSAGEVPRTLTLVTQYVAPGDAGSMPVILNSLDNEVTVAFSFSYNINPFAAPPTVVCGSNAPGCTVATNTTILGRVGVTITPVGGAFTEPTVAGPKEIARINFQTLATSLSSTPIAFVSTPTTPITLDAAGNSLLTVYVDGAVVFAQGKEGDTAGRFEGSGTVDAPDVVQVRRFVTGLDTPNPMFNEFQRADTAPSASKGNGFLDSTDVIQVRRYAAGLDGSQTAGGQGAANPASIPSPEAETENARSIGVGSANASTGSRVSIPVEIVANGDETAVSFVINYDHTRLGKALVDIGDAPEGTALTVNTDELGKVRVLIDGVTPFGRSKDKQVMAYVSFDVAPTAPTGDTTVEIESVVISDARANSLKLRSTNGAISIAGPNALGVTISGRVMTPTGEGLANAIVTMLAPNGAIRTVTTGTFGYYQFEAASDYEYTLSVASRRYRFEPRRVTQSGQLAKVDFIARQ